MYTSNYTFSRRYRATPRGIHRGIHANSHNQHLPATMFTQRPARAASFRLYTSLVYIFTGRTAQPKPAARNPLISLRLDKPRRSAYIRLAAIHIGDVYMRDAIQKLLNLMLISFLDGVMFILSVVFIFVVFWGAHLLYLRVCEILVYIAHIMGAL